MKIVLCCMKANKKKKKKKRPNGEEIYLVKIQGYGTLLCLTSIMTLKYKNKNMERWSDCQCKHYPSEFK